MNKRGSVIIEASIVMPITLIIAIMLITISITFYSQLLEQVKEHTRELENKSYQLQMEIIRNNEKIKE